MTFIGALLGLAMVLGVGWFAVQAQRNEGDRRSLWGSLKRLRRGADNPEMDETFADELAPPDQQARDKGAV